MDLQLRESHGQRREGRKRPTPPLKNFSFGSLDRLSLLMIGPRLLV